MSAQKFCDLSPSLSDETVSCINNKFEFQFATPVQAATIPLFLTNKDVCVEATTGSGKTLAFGIPILEILLRKSADAVNFGKHDVGALVVAPTRELADQIYSVLSLLCSDSKFRCGLLVGGTDVDISIREFVGNGAQIIVGTPGRIIDFAGRCEVINLRKLEVLILDEADTLLDMGFKADINKIFAMLPKMRRTGLFSATQTKEIKELARAGMRNPVTITVKVQQQQASAGAHSSSSKLSSEPANLAGASGGANSTIPITLDNYYDVCDYESRPQRLAEFLVSHRQEKVIVFCATCASAEYYSLVFAHFMPSMLGGGMGQVSSSSAASTSTASELSKVKYDVVALHGKMIPKKRNALFKRFLSLSIGCVLFCTDVAARGIDIPDVDWIVQLAAPKDPAFCTHRIGRTARAGRRGGAVLYIADHEKSYIDLLQTRGVRIGQFPGTDNGNVVETAESSVDVNAAMKGLAAKDRVILEAGSTAFMSFLRAYKEHLCSFIFRVEELNIGQVARSFGLLRLPKIPETQGRKRASIDFVDAVEVDTSKIPYKHKEKEQARQKRLVDMIATQKNEEVARAEKKKKLEEKKAAQALKGVEDEVEKRKRKKKLSKHQAIMEEWNELAAEETMFKKLKKGKVSDKEYENMFFSEETVADIDTVMNLHGTCATNGSKETIEDSSYDSDDSM